MTTTKRFVGLAVGLVTLYVGAPLALENLELSVARVDGGSWSARAVTIDLDLAGSTPAVR